MKFEQKKLVPIIVAIVIIIVAIFIGAYLIKKNKEAQVIGNTENGLEAENSDLESKAGVDALGSGLADNAEPQTKIITDAYSMDLPSGWQEVTPIEGVSAMAVNAQDNITDTAAQAVGFQSYFAVSQDALSGGTLNDYVQTVKTSLSQNISGISFTKEKDFKINGVDAHAIESELTQEGIDFKVLLVMMTGTSDDVWVLSFNTVKSSWNSYEKLFYEIADSFALKK